MLYYAIYYICRLYHLYILKNIFLIILPTYIVPRYNTKFYSKSNHDFGHLTVKIMEMYNFYFIHNILFDM